MDTGILSDEFDVADTVSMDFDCDFSDTDEEDDDDAVDGDDDDDDDDVDDRDDDAVDADGDDDDGDDKDDCNDEELPRRSSRIRSAPIRFADIDFDARTNELQLPADTLLSIMK